MLKPFLWLFLTLVLMSCSSRERLCAQESKVEDVSEPIPHIKSRIAQVEPIEPPQKGLQDDLPLVIEPGPENLPVEPKLSKKQRRRHFVQNLTENIEKMGGYTIHSKGITEAKYLMHFFNDIKHQKLLKRYKNGLPFALNKPPGKEHEHKIQIGVVLPAYQQFESDEGKVHLVYPSSPVRTIILGEVSLAPEYTEKDYVEACHSCYSIWRHEEEKKQKER